MDQSKLLKFILIPLSIVSSLCVFLIAGVWIYRKNIDKISDSDISYIQSPSLSNDAFLSSSYGGDMREESVTSDTVEDNHIIRSGNISVAVDDIDGTLDSISGIKDSSNGTYVSLSDYGKGKDRVVSIVLKVEESKFDSVYAELKSLDGEYVNSSISESDVSDTVMDLEARLSNYKSVEQQYLKILETASSVEDTLAVYRELNEVRYNIERLEGDLKNIGNQTDYSYIYLYISQSSTGGTFSDEEWKPLGEFKDAVRALVEFAKFLGSAIIWVVVFIPVLALVVIPVWLVSRRRK